MAHAERCPICYGKGELPNENVTANLLAPLVKTCHGCQRRGWVMVGESMTDYYKEGYKNTRPVR